MNLDLTRAYIDESFARAFGARKASGFQQHMSVDRAERGKAVLGYRRAGDDTLFVESYLDEPVEQAVSAAFGQRIQRSRIVEIGNLATDNAWSMLALWGTAANDLGAVGDVAVAALTAPLRRMFDRIGVPLHALAPAAPDRLGAAAADWGSYYESDPWVCASWIAAGQRAIAALAAPRRNRAA